jgi:uncharacterized protein YwgA
MKKNTKKDFYNEIGLLYLVAISNGIHSRIRLQKLVCITQFTQKKLSPFSFDFKSHYYGPYSESLRRKIDDLVHRELIDEKIIYKSDDLDVSESVFSYFYSLTEKGGKFLQKNLNSFGRKISAIERVVKRCDAKPNETVIEIAKKVSKMKSIK